VKIRTNLRWLILTGFCGLAIFAAVAFTALLQIEVNGPIYQRVSLSKEVVEDYVAPPESLLQVALYCRMMNETDDPVQRQRFIGLFGTVERNFDRLHADYMRRVPEGTLKNMMRGTAYETAQQYFQIARQEYIPLVTQGDREKARALLLARMKPVYEQHVAAVDQIVAVANEEARTGEVQAARSVRRYTEVMAGVGLLILVAGGTLGATIARGISEQTEDLVRSEQSRREQAGRLNSVLTCMGEGVVLADRAGRFLVWNTAAEKIFGPVATAFKVEQWASHYGLYLLDGTTLCPTEQLPLVCAGLGRDCDMELLIKKPHKGADVWLDISARPFKDGSDAVLGGVAVFRDASERRRAKEELQQSFEQLRALAGRLQSIREEERKRVARDIHDQLGQALTAIKIDVSALVRQWPGDQTQRAEKAAAILKLVDDTIQAVRRISTELRPGILDDLGLVATIEWAGEEFEARTGTTCRLDLPFEDLVVDQDQATAIFRILQETLTNVARHADAKNVEVRLAKQNSRLTLEVHDDGRGIPEDRLSRNESLGILGMRERAMLIGGDLAITGAPGRGTTVRVTIPYALAT
jgi:signal transduction histidine kinase